jgi:hypothetical protein
VTFKPKKPPYRHKNDGLQNIFCENWAFRFCEGQKVRKRVVFLTLALSQKRFSQKRFSLVYTPSTTLSPMFKIPDAPELLAEDSGMPSEVFAGIIGEISRINSAKLTKLWTSICVFRAGANVTSMPRCNADVRYDKMFNYVAMHGYSLLGGDLKGLLPIGFNIKNIMEATFTDYEKIKDGAQRDASTLITGESFWKWYLRLKKEVVNVPQWHWNDNLLSGKLPSGVALKQFLMMVLSSITKKKTTGENEEEEDTPLDNTTTDDPSCGPGCSWEQVNSSMHSEIGDKADPANPKTPSVSEAISRTTGNQSSTSSSSSSYSSSDGVAPVSQALLHPPVSKIPPCWFVFIKTGTPAWMIRTVTPSFIFYSNFNIYLQLQLHYVNHSTRLFLNWCA